jgi:Tfp pilus assembly major pilin PilA
MPALKAETTEYHKTLVRRAITLNPCANIVELKKVLETGSNPLNIDRAYLRKIVHMIRKERIHRFDTALVTTKLAEIEDETIVIKEYMWRLLLSSTTKAGEKVAAARAITNANQTLLDMQMNAGVYDRKIGTLEVQHTHTLTPEVMAPILRAMANYGIVHMEYATPNTLPSGDGNQ